MKNNRAISMVSLVITIILIIILAAISGFYLTSIISDSELKDVKEEIKNIENVIEFAKSEILIDEFMPNAEFLVSDDELDLKFPSLTQEEKDYIKQVNKSETIQAPYKFYLMDQNRFDQEFGNDFNVSNLRPLRDYLVNYMSGYVMAEFGNQKVANADDLIPTGGISGDVNGGYGDAPRAEIRVAFTPNGNAEWKRQQTTMLSITTNESAVIKASKYLVTQSYTQPRPEDFLTQADNGTEVSMTAKTGSDWFVWVYIEYTDNGVDKTYAVRSNAFYLDNEPPTGTLSVTNINR